MENTADIIINKVAQSSLITLNLADYYPKNAQIIFDIKDYLLHGFVLQEKNYRAALADHNWLQYSQCNVGVYCSTDAIVPTWAYMLVATYLDNIADTIYFGDDAALTVFLYEKALENIDYTQFDNKKVIIKGCGDTSIPAAAYLRIAAKLTPHVASLMYGEACSTVPIFKKK